MQVRRSDRVASADRERSRWRSEELERDPVRVAERDARSVVRVDDAAVGDPELVEPGRPVLQLVAVAARYRADEPAMLGHAFALQAYLAMQTNDITSARGWLDQARDVTAYSDDWMLDVRTRLLESILLVVEGRDGGRDSVLEIVEPAVDHLDQIHSSGLSSLAYFDVEQRRLPEAAAVLNMSLPLTVEFDLPICHVWQLGTRGRLWLVQGDWRRSCASPAVGKPPGPGASSASSAEPSRFSGRAADRSETANPCEAVRRRIARLQRLQPASMR